MKKAYQKLLNTKQLESDPAQLQAVDALQQLSEQLQTRASQPSLPVKPIKGLYFHGRVGRGKTMLMDLFFNQLKIENKKRIHFHHFMESVHNQLSKLTGQAEPLSIIANEWARDIDVLCFDEFFVNDIADAMLLAGLFEQLFIQDVTLVTTSNCQPEALYRNGLQRERFLPTIALINQYCQVVSINGEVDHRRNLSQKNSAHQNYFVIDKGGDKKLIHCYKTLTSQEKLSSGELLVNNRYIDYLAKSNDVIYFDFFALCSGPRSQRDYMALAKNFHTVFISGVPKFSGTLVPAVVSGVEESYQRTGVLMAELQQLDDEARRFIALVDEFYDRGIKLVLSAAVDIFDLYQGKQLAFEFERCQSRLIEMQHS